MRRNRHGVSLTEAILMMPIFLFLVFGLLQLGQLGLGLVVVNYSAGSMARKIGRTSAQPQSVADGLFSRDYKDLMVAGMHADSLTACYETNSADPVAKSVIVTAQASIAAFPVIGPFLNTMAPNFSASARLPPPCTVKSVPAIGFTGPPQYNFIVRGMAVTRRDYLN